jgi:release factor H-coupled RctB family protein
MNAAIQYGVADVTWIATENTRIEGSAIQQLEHVRSLPGMQRVVGMPDLHPGQGYPVGAAFFSVGYFYPALIGNDIGCGMTLWRTALEKAKHTSERLEKRLGNIDGPLDSDWGTEIAAFNLPPTDFESSLGTIGGGNHFAEIQHVDEVFDIEALAILGIDKRQLLLLVHSGSRGLGEKILRRQIDQFSHQGLQTGSEAAQVYLAEHQTALRFAHANRRLIGLRILSQLRADGEVLIDLHHNLLESTAIDGQDGWLHRKGASPANAGPVVIPGSRGDFSYLVQPVPHVDSLFSIAHGAGRKWMRSECKARLSSRYRVEQFLKTPLGNRVVCGDKNLMFEEAPEAYKRVDSVIEPLLQAGLIRLIARLKPVLTYKTSRNLS